MKPTHYNTYMYIYICICMGIGEQVQESYVTRYNVAEFTNKHQRSHIHMYIHTVVTYIECYQ